MTSMLRKIRKIEALLDEEGDVVDVTYFFHDAQNPDEPFGRSEFNGSSRKVLEDLEERLATSAARFARRYDPDFGDDRVCSCGHAYYRHFDTYEDMAPVGCKYCGCFIFQDITR